VVLQSSEPVDATIRTRTIAGTPLGSGWLRLRGLNDPLYTHLGSHLGRSDNASSYGRSSTIQESGRHSSTAISAWWMVVWDFSASPVPGGLALNCHCQRRGLWRRGERYRRPPASTRSIPGTSL